MSHLNGNGHKKDDMEKLHEDIFYLRETVDFQLNKIADVISGLNANVNTQNKILEVYIKMQRWALPMPLVTMMFAVLLVLIFGKESIEWFYSHKLFQISPQ